MRKYPGWPLLLAALMTLAACGSGSSSNRSAAAPAPAPAPPPATGTLEVIHASQDAPAVNVRVDGDELISDLPYRGVAAASLETGDLEVEVDGIVPGGNVTVIPAAGAAAPVVTLGADQRVTVIAANTVANIAPIVLTDEPPAVAADEVRLRVLHAASAAPMVDVFITAPGDPLGAATGTFSFGDLLTADALVVPAGAYQVRVTPAGDPSTVVYDSGPIDLPGGADLVIAAVTNTLAGDSPIALLATTGTDTFEFADVDTPSDLRAVHAAPDAPAVDIIANDDFATPAVPGLAFPEVTGYLNLTPGPINVKVVPEGATDPVVIDADLTLDAGAAYTVFAAGPLAAIEPLVLVDDNRRVATEARIRLVHAAPSAGEVDIYVVASGTDFSTVDPAFSSVPFLADTGYVPLAPGDYDVVVTGAGSTVPAIGPVSLTLDAGGIYTAAARDEFGGGLPPGLILLDDLVP